MSDSSSATPAFTDARLIRRLLRLTWSYRWSCIAVFTYQVALLALGLLGLSFTGLAIDVVRHELWPGAPAPRWPLAGFLATLPAYQAVMVLGGAVLVMAALRALLNYLYTVQVADLVQMRVVPTLRGEVYDKLQILSFRFFDEHASGSLINRVTGDVQSLRSFIDGVLIQGGIMFLSLGIYVAYMLAKHPGLALLTLLPTPLLWLATTRFSQRVQPAYARNRARVDDLVLGFSEAVQGIQVTKIFAAEQHQLRTFSAKNHGVFESQRHVFKDVSRFSALIDGLGHANIAILLAFGGYLVARERLTLGDLIVFAGLLQQFSAQVSRAAGVVNTLQQSLTGARRVYEVLDAPIDVRNAASATAPAAGAGAVRFERVSFAYAGQARLVLEDIELDVPAGKCVAIVGEMGSGKSTLLSLVPRFYDPVSGVVRIDGVDVKDLELNEMRRKIGVVFQNNLLFRDTVLANIAFGHPEATAQQVEQAARLARAHDFIVALPQGYATKVEAGASNLSGGQRQRVALARALLLEPRILLLDDPTSGIDAVTERELIGALTEARQGRTTLIATHRISLARRADMIVVLQKGRIVERGTHTELLGRGGVYGRAAELQGLVDAAQALRAESA